VVRLGASAWVLVTYAVPLRRARTVRDGRLGGVSDTEVRRTLASRFAIAARQYADTAAVLATLGTSGTDYARLRDQTIKGQAQSEVAFKEFTEHVDSHQCDGATQNGY
jgi:hypothetical protein